MNTTLDQPSIAEQRDLSLIRGGPFYRAQQAARLIRPNEWNHVRRVAFAVALGWVPLILITVFSQPEALMSLLRDYRVHSRMLIAVPVLLFGDLLLENRFRMVVAQFTRAGLAFSRNCKSEPFTRSGSFTVLGTRPNFQRPPRAELWLVLARVTSGWLE
jgi:hypothetical protein